MKCEKSVNHTISYQSLLLSTTVLNDECDNGVLTVKTYANGVLTVKIYANGACTNSSFQGKCLYI